MLAAIVLAGCYHYVPGELSDLGPGTDTRVRITESEASRFATILPGGDRRLLEGRVVQRGTDSLLLQVAVSSNLVGTRVETLSQRIDLAQHDITNVELRRLDKWKTGLLIGGAAGVGTALLVSTLTGAFNSNAQQPGDGGRDTIVPVFLRIRF